MTDNFKKETMKVSSGVVALLLMKISHEIDEYWTDDIRLVANTSSIMSNGETYEPYDISFSAPKEGGGRRTTNITINDIFRGITSKLEQVTDSIVVDICIVTSNAPDIKEKDYGIFSVDSYSIAGKNITLSVSLQTVLRDSLSSHTVEPADFPGLFLI